MRSSLTCSRGSTVEVQVPDEKGLKDRRCYFINFDVTSTDGLIPFSIYVDVHSEEVTDVEPLDESISITALPQSDFTWLPL